MKLTISDKILLPTIFPAEAKYEALICIRDIKKKMEITQEDVKEFNIQTLENGSVSWKVSDKTFDYKFTEMEKQTILNSLKKLDEQEKLTEQLLPLCKLFDFRKK